MTCITAAGPGWVFDATSEALAAPLVLRMAWWTGGIALLVSLGLVLQVVVLRARAARRRRRHEATICRWRPVLLARAAGLDVERPRLLNREREPLLLVWNQLQEGLRGSAHRALGELALELGLDAHARALAQAGATQQRLLGLSTLAHLGLADDGPMLEEQLRDPRSVVSMTAVRGLIRIDPVRGTALALEAFTQRPDWPLARLATLLQEAGSAAVGPALEALIGGADDARLLHVLPLVTLLDQGRQSVLLRRVLETTRHPVVLEKALSLLMDPQALPRVRELAQHEDWTVRSRAAMVLGRIGLPEDRRGLVSMLSDRQWWVRYRAAAALLTLPDVDDVDIAALRAGLRERYARDILAHALAERSPRMHGGAA